jgi:hypothetical protein
MTCRAAVLAFCILASSCGEPTSTRPSPTAISFGSLFPANGSSVTIPERYPYNQIGGVVLPPGSGVLSVPLTISSARALPLARLNVYMLTGGSATEYCGQNLPDSPSWTSLPANWTTTVDITGFQVYRLPCDVTALRVMLHSRSDTHLAIPPSAAETIVEATLPVSIALRR